MCQKLNIAAIPRAGLLTILKRTYPSRRIPSSSRRVAAIRAPASWFSARTRDDGWRARAWRAHVERESRSRLTARRLDRSQRTARKFSPRYKHGRPRGTVARLSTCHNIAARGVVEPYRGCETALRKSNGCANFFRAPQGKTAMHRSSGGRDLKIDREFGGLF